MSDTNEKATQFPQNDKRLLRFVVVCVAGIVLNMLGAYIVDLFKLPIFLDTTGTVVVSVMSGYLPGIFVGLFTNVLKMAFIDSSSIYYAFINVFIAVIAYGFAAKGYMKKIIGVIGFIILISLIGGAHEAILVWVRAEFAVNGKSGFSAFMDYFLAELFDKSITVIILVLIMVILPKKVKDWIVTEGWQQTPLTKEEKKAVKKIRIKGHSLRTKILILLISACFTIGATATVISVVLFKEATIEEHMKLAEGTASLIASQIDGDFVDAFIEAGEKSLKYQKTESFLQEILNSSPEITYVYVYQIQEDGCHVVFDLDTDEMEGAAPGTVIPFDESFKSEVPKLLRGEKIDAIITDDSYGWLITAYVPVFDSNGTCKCYAAADISMGVIWNKEAGFLVKLISLFLGFFILVIAIGLWISEYNIILPVKTMAHSARAFEYDDEEDLERNVEHIKNIKIRTRDEIENMYQAFAKTTENNYHYMSDLRNKNETITHMQDALIMVLADMVESRDENTGDHVRKTAAYTRVIMEKLREKGVYADQLTDQFMFDVERSAPLHDIGKISVSDNILNKNGKLTDEEFEKMKLHTVVGADIIQKTIEHLPESGYLEEAKNIAHYHHEKWNGKGYPEGLSGEDIPLSARIMAVADVFDALVSERCYKKAFPFEKAMDIIREDAGTHFDPEVAAAFLESEEKVRSVMEMITENIPNKKK